MQPTPVTPSRKVPPSVDLADKNSRTIWYPHYDSNVDLLLRTEMFYPLNYGDSPGAGVCLITNALGD